MLLKNVKESDLGSYNCLAVNILGKAQALVQLEVNGKVNLRPSARGGALENLTIIFI